MPRQPTTWLQISGYRFLLRRRECALLGGDLDAGAGRLREPTASVALGCVLAAIALAACAGLALLRPQAALDRAQILMEEGSGALYVRVGDVWHPVLNLASARLIAATAANPLRVRESDLARTKRGPELGIPGAPQYLGTPMSADESAWSMCDTDDAGATTVVVARTQESPVRRLAPGQAVLVASGAGSPSYLLYGGQRSLVDLTDTATVRALRLEGRTPRPVSQSLLRAVPEAPPIQAPQLRGGGTKARGVPGFTVGSVLRIARADGDEYYAVLAAGLQRVGQVAADLLRFTDAQGAAHTILVAPDVVRAAPIVDALPVAGFPDRAPTLIEGGDTLCITWDAVQSGVALLAGDGLPVPAGGAPVHLSQADGRGPALDAFYLPPGRSAYVRDGGGSGTRYLITDTGVRFAIHDENAARDLGLPAPIPAPWPALAALPAGAELSRQSASVARDTGAP